jgi:hypothetical protein
MNFFGVRQTDLRHASGTVIIFKIAGKKRPSMTRFRSPGMVHLPQLSTGRICKREPKINPKSHLPTDGTGPKGPVEKSVGKEYEGDASLNQQRISGNSAI